ncbi:NAD(P)-binding domain-containing protein [Litchfieldia salsa]|uniref:L-lysine 6-monooxygenase (NADPH-requiring) n=1 Tax=Litchfieldia salsa TaxID=930152 RepID=A0A1H0UAL8_9BACI|nr:FAD/NAD(P)-binding protein [Litchfieldia salsa]SDP63048.1 L-lysine 6-monooxygenase (NADPH-requiring) [Litchfieldia salsa]
MYDWLVIGGGIHGCTISTYLIKHKKVQIERLCIIDPHTEPMARWKRNTERISMQYLRSPSVHHIDVPPFSLQQFSKISEEHNRFYGVYKRPSLELFNEHCDEVICETDLQKSWHRGLVESIRKEKGDWRVTTEKGEVIRSKNIVIAISVNEQLLIPNWAKELTIHEPKRVQHIFDENQGDITEIKAPIAIIGGGISAAHLAIKMSREYPGEVTLIKRHPFRVHDFDSDPGWLGLKLQGPYRKLKDYNVRREKIKEARLKGSIPRDVLRKVKSLEAEQKLRIINGEVSSYKMEPEYLMLNINDISIQTRSILLATGFSPTRPGKWVEKLIEVEKLSCAQCGYPIVDENLQWYPHLYVIGPLAELEIGPIARNISGARQAAERIVSHL